MKLLQFGKDTATVGGKKVPYSLLGALAAILGAFLIWKFNQAGGLSLGQQSPDLSDLGDGGGGSDGLGDALSNALGLPPSGSVLPPPIWGYGAGEGGSVPGKTTTVTVPSSKTVPISAGHGGPGVGFDPGTSYVAPSGGGAGSILGQIDPRAKQPPSAPSSGGSGVGFDPGGNVAPTPKTKPPPAPTGGGGGGSFTG